MVESVEDIQVERLTPEELRDAWPVLELVGVCGLVTCSSAARAILAGRLP